MGSLSARVAERFRKEAMEFSSPAALEKYLKLHPKADKSKHRVKDTSPEKKAPKKEESTKKPPPKQEKAPTLKKAPKLALKGPLAVTDAQLDELIAKHKNGFNFVVSCLGDTYEKDLAKFRSAGPKARDLSDGVLAEFDKLPKIEKQLHLNGHLLAVVFQNEVLTEEERSLHARYVNSWTGSSVSAPSQKVHGALSKLGVQGHKTEEDERQKAQSFRETGSEDKKLQEYLGKVYAFTQAFYKHIGVKEVTLFRGVEDAALVKAEDFQEVSIETRELSSYTTNPDIAKLFGRPIAFKVPVEQILWSNLNSTQIHDTDEAEVAVMGASSLTGYTFGGPVKKD